ncbi:MAG: FtsX-like permease family protein [Bacteroidetes bacterium]|nr:FtsX-like permease family protein [Bacteroidota bacterium]MDA0943698.1 FtsX-like permease family protein [Bacteroidota bacterium]MDA1111521.1 FtsX-like permease family protein [Bacteroidota bacterium]
MRFVWTLAWKYFFSKRNPTAVNWISGIALVGYGIGSAALLILLSALNGFETIIFDGYEKSDPAYRIMPLQGKTFELSSADSLTLATWPGVWSGGPVSYDKGILQHDQGETVVEVFGMSAGALSCIQLDSLLVAGENRLKGNSMAASMAAALSYRINLGAGSGYLTLMAPDPESVSLTQTQLIMEPIRATALLALEQDGQSQRVYVTYSLAQDLFVHEGACTQWFLNGQPDRGDLESWLKQRGLKLEDRHEQHASLYRMFNTEKWVAFALFAFVLLLISFNLLGSLSMLVLAKAQDMRYLEAAGMNKNLRSFWVFAESLLIGLVGSVSGLLLGWILVEAQVRYAFIKTQGTYSLAYPVEFRPENMLLILGLALVLALLSAIVPALISSRSRWSSKP